MVASNLFHVALYSAALIICVTSLIFTFSQKRIDKLQNKLYILVVSITALNAVSLIITEMCKPFALTDRGYFNVIKVSEMTYFLFHTALCPLFCLYVLNVCGGRTRKSMALNLLYASPFILTELLVISNPFTHWVYSYTENNTFKREWGENLIYIAAALYFGVSIFLLFFSWRALTPKRRIALIYFFLLVVTGVVIQFINIEIKSELFAEALALLGVMTAIESEDDRIDTDTGIYNRKALMTDLTTYIAGGRTLSLICLKITNAELVERAKGSDNSDLLQTAVSEYLITMTPRYNIYSTSPGTFIVILLDEGRDRALEFSQQIIDRFEKPWSFDETELILSAVIMAADVPERIKTASEALYMADCPMPAGNDKKILSGKDLDFLMRRAAVEKALNKGIEDQCFEVYYQPTYSLTDRKLHGAEALVRLHDSVLGTVYPDEFIPIAEQIGMIDDIDDFVLREVCKFIKSGIPQKYGIHSINVNLSVIECMQPDFIAHINSVTEQYGIEKECINFEITESIAANDYDTLSHTVAALKADGFRFSMDDYGTGYSNMRAIFMLDFDVVKIDKSILWSAEDSELGKIILENSVRMIKQMHREILVEGVETQHQIDMLSLLSVDYLQGYFFSKPIPKEDFIALISRERK
ncbi:MAG: EAL domain-containing protein [Ruminococcus sp.]|nr:EAL domain-containing protein [Ruminococcus sp.]